MTNTPAARSSTIECLDQMETNLKADIAATKVEIIKWVLGAMLAVATAQSALFFGMLKFAL